MIFSTIKKNKRWIATLLFCAVAVFLVGCTPIQYEKNDAPDFPEKTTTKAVETTSPPLKVDYNENPISIPKITYSAFNNRVQLEDCTEKTVYQNLKGYTGSGYIQLSSYDYVTFTVTVPSTQHYKIILRACAVETTISLITGGTKKITTTSGYETIDGTVWGAFYAENTSIFTPLVLDGIFLEEGENTITLQALKGVAYMDFIDIESSTTLFSMDSTYNDVPKVCANKNVNFTTSCIMQFLADTYGEKVLTGQYCTPNTNAEMEAIYKTTGRYPAIRNGDLSQFSKFYTGANAGNKEELYLAKEWSKKGGLVSYSFNWYAPTETSHYFSHMTDFKLDSAVSKIDLATANPAQLDVYLNDGTITKYCYDLIQDIDSISAALVMLKDADVTVLWRPLMEASSKWFWWGNCKPESYIWLWQLMFDRMTLYHGLDNLIWVWNGEEKSYYPGDDYVDIISEDIYNESKSASSDRFINAHFYTPNAKPIALSECGRVPSPNVLSRDNTLWLWFSLYKGDYLIKNDGTINAAKCDKTELYYAYNHELTLTLDELPNLFEYGTVRE